MIKPIIPKVLSKLNKHAAIKENGGIEDGIEIYEHTSVAEGELGAIRHFFHRAGSEMEYSTYRSYKGTHTFISFGWKNRTCFSFGAVIAGYGFRFSKTQYEGYGSEAIICKGEIEVKREWSISYLDRAIGVYYGNIDSDDGRIPYKLRSRYKFFQVDDILYGKPDYGVEREEPLTWTQDDLTITSRIDVRTWTYKRFKKPQERWYLDFEVAGDNIPKRCGKGENSWDCDDEELDNASLSSDYILELTGIDITKEPVTAEKMFTIYKAYVKAEQKRYGEA